MTTIIGDYYCYYCNLFKSRNPFWSLSRHVSFNFSVAYWFYVNLIHLSFFDFNQSSCLSNTWLCYLPPQISNKRNIWYWLVDNDPIYWSRKQFGLGLLFINSVHDISMLHMRICSAMLCSCFKWAHFTPINYFVSLTFFSELIRYKVSNSGYPYIK